MKKIVAMIMVVAIMVATMCGCGNRTVFDTKWTFKYATLDRGRYTETFKIDSWHDFEGSDMVQFTTEDGTTYLTHSCNVIFTTK